MNLVYGPVPSWRLGRSLGIDLICSYEKRCSFDCNYCQLGNIGKSTAKRGIFVSLNNLEHELKAAIGKAKCDVITFSGTGEPTLAGNLDDAIDIVFKCTKMPMAILTNSSLMNMGEVRMILRKLDIVVAKLDAPNSEAFKKINRPADGVTFDKVVDGIKRFRTEFDGKLAIQVMFMDDNKEFAEEIAIITRDLAPDEVQINTPLRPCHITPLSKTEMRSIEQHFGGLNVISVYNRERPKTIQLSKRELAIRRGNAYR